MVDQPTLPYLEPIAWLKISLNVRCNAVALRCSWNQTKLLHACKTKILITHFVSFSLLFGNFTKQ